MKEIPQKHADALNDMIRKMADLEKRLTEAEKKKDAKLIQRLDYELRVQNNLFQTYLQST